MRVYSELPPSSRSVGPVEIASPFLVLGILHSEGTRDQTFSMKERCSILTVRHKKGLLSRLREAKTCAMPMQLISGSGRESSVPLDGRYQCPCIKQGRVSLRSIICGKARSVSMTTVAVNCETGSDIGSRARKSDSCALEKYLSPKRVV